MMFLAQKLCCCTSLVTRLHAIIIMMMMMMLIIIIVVICKKKNCHYLIIQQFYLCVLADLEERMAAVVNRVADVLSVAPPPLGGLEPCNVNRRDKGDYSKLSSNRRSLVVEVESSSMRARREVEDTRYDRCVEEP